MLRSWRNSLPPERARQLVVQCQVNSPENMRTSNVKQTEQVTSVYLKRNIHVCSYTHMCTNKTRGHKFEREQVGEYEKFCREERDRRMI